MPREARDAEPAMTRSLIVLISTHDRVALLERTLHYLNAARHPQDWRVEILVVANACSDRTHAMLDEYRETIAAPAVPSESGRLPLRWLAEPTPGKSHALNRATRF
jgi:hypothetical protein